MKLIAGLKSALPFALVMGFVACSSSKNGFDSDPPAIGRDSDAEAPQPCGGSRCSRDLHAVVDGCTDTVIQACAPDMGCADSRCVPACDSAAASQGSTGCSFWAVPPDPYAERDSSCYAAFVTNTWNLPVSVTAEYGDAPLDVSKSVYRASLAADGHIDYQPIEGAIPPGEVGIVFLAQGNLSGNDSFGIACPVGVNVALLDKVVKDHRTSIYKAFHLSTDLPVSAYTIFPYGGARSAITSSTLLLPSTSWGTNYLLIEGWESQAGLGNPFNQIVAQEETEVRVLPVAEIKDGAGVTGGDPGVVATWTLKRGQVLELSQVASLAGSTVQTNHPVAVFGGSQCSDVPTGIHACDTLHQQIPPIQQWASKYSAVPYESRRLELDGKPKLAESVLWKVVGARNGTTLTYDPAPPENAPTTLKAGESALFYSEVPFTVKSQGNDYPFYVANYMTGGDKYWSLGDPEFVNVVPDEQFLDHYVFFVDQTHSDSTLTFVRRKDESGFHDVTLDCFGTLSGWQSLGKDASVEYAWVDLTRHHAAVSSPIGTCSYGRHEASSNGPFALYVWGTDSYSSYGFPAGAGSRPTSPYVVDIR